MQAPRACSRGFRTRLERNQELLKSDGKTRTDVTQLSAASGFMQRYTAEEIYK